MREEQTGSVPPAPPARLRFREMQLDDLDQMAALLGDPEVMDFYPHPKSRDEAAAWSGQHLRPSRLTVFAPQGTQVRCR